mmetsp:Transcript_38693/g.60332  ORF Transcript_38693/g.60332 Transcript_38693/m.60332 type:complete len:453 (+) Transcript_38693:277-1635(+)|eukprot:CAMPEP_0184308690 /NCGR_PEP_ID=MMETSP1049-20130417/17071_1 /TAXON_ID=77928 /ORGANISM="Proteomonas sulcata, Strain CCMP704" /LENGTH=452 /DNA_ID=CAMNT_0026621419 /DNA_START=268 /DNA_END=1626 /DNA_ORIENTATION=+
MVEHDDSKSTPRLLVPKLIYFFQFLGNAFFTPFVPVFLAQVGLGNGEIGTFFSVRPFISSLAGPAWGYASDRLGMHKLLLAVALAGSACFRFCMVLSSSVTWVIGFLILSDFFSKATGPIIDSTCLDMLPDPSLYGKQRLWGAIGWGWIGAPLAGIVLAEYGITAMFICHLAGVLVTLSIVLHLNVKMPASRSSPWQVVSVVVKDRRTSLFFFANFVLGQGFGIVGSFLFLFLKELGDKGLFMGFSLMFTCITEVPVMYYCDRIIKRMGLMRSIFFCLFGKGIRFLYYFTFVYEPAMVLVVEGLHGIIFGIFWTAGVQYVHKISPKELGATMQGFYGSWVHGFGSGVGSLVGGWLAESLGLRTMFGLAAAWTLVVAVICCTADVFGFLGVSNVEEDSFYEQFDSGTSRGGTPERQEASQHNNGVDNGEAKAKADSAETCIADGKINGNIQTN